jgi:BrnA antitoxin of type II toxin-antitoxin system
MPMPKEIVTMRLDADLLRWFRQQRGYQTRINAILRAYMRRRTSQFKGGRPLTHHDPGCPTLRDFRSVGTTNLDAMFSSHSQQRAWSSFHN